MERNPPWIVNKDCDEFPDERDMVSNKMSMIQKDMRSEYELSKRTNPYLMGFVPEFEERNIDHEEVNPLDNSIIFQSGINCFDLNGDMVYISTIKTEKDLDVLELSNFEMINRPFKMHYFDLGTYKDSRQHKEVLDNLKQGEHFKDLVFDTNLQSIEGYYPDRIKREWGNIGWRRAHEMTRSKDIPKLFGDDPVPCDVAQGAIGNCFFICSLSSISIVSDRVKKLFCSKSQIYNQSGSYCIYLCINGIWEEILVDDYLPTIDNKHPLFSRSPTKKIWPMMIEKAWGKIMGGYMNLVSGSPSETLFALTGAPTHSYKVIRDKPLVIAKQIHDGLLKNHPLTGCTGSETDESQGLQKSHAYSIIDIFCLTEVIDESYGLLNEFREDADIILLKIRNPWSNQGNWRGKWSYGHAIWNKNRQIQEILGYLQNTDRGIIFIQLQDFVNAFSTITICFPIPDAKYSSVLIKQDTKIHLYEFEVDSQSLFEVGFVQANPRQFGVIDTDYRFANVSLVVCRKRKEGLMFWRGISKAHHIQSKRMDLKEGTYRVVLSTNWKNNADQGVMNFYGPSFVQLKKIDCPEGLIIEELCGMYMRYSNKKNTSKFIVPQGAPSTISYLQESADDGFRYFHFRNMNSKLKVLFTINIMEMESIIFIQDRYKHVSNNQIDVILDSNREEIVLMRQIDIPCSIKYYIEVNIQYSN